MEELFIRANERRCRSVPLHVCGPDVLLLRRKLPDGRCPCGVFGLIFIGLVLLAIGAGEDIANVTKAGGWVTLAFAVLAWYHAAGDVIAATFGREVLPVFSLRRPA